MSSEAEPKARLSSESLSDNTFFAASFSGGQITSSPPNASSSAYTPHPLHKTVKTDITNEESTASSENGKPSLPLFWRSGNSSSNKPPEPKEVNVVAPFGEKSKGKKTYVKSLLEQITGKPTSKDEENVVDEELVKGIFPVHQSLSVEEDPEFFPENNLRTGEGDDGHQNEDVAAKIDQAMIPEESKDKPSAAVKDVPKPPPRVQLTSNKEKPEEKQVVPKPAPRSGKVNKASDSESTTSTPDPQPMERSMPESIIEHAARAGATPVDSRINSGSIGANLKMASPLIEEYNYRLSVIPENPEVASDDELLDAKDQQSGIKAQKEVGSAKPINEESLYSSKDSKGKPSDVTNSEVKAEVEISDSAHQPPSEIPASNTYSNSSSNSVSLPNDKTNPSSTESPANPTTDDSDKESTGKKKLLRAWVSPSETHPIPTVQSGGAVSSRQR